MTTLVKSARNIAGVKTTFANILNAYDVLNADKLVVDQGSPGQDRGGVRANETAYDIIMKPVITEQSMAGIADQEVRLRGRLEMPTRSRSQRQWRQILGVKVAKVNTINVCRARPSARACSPR